MSAPLGRHIEPPTWRLVAGFLGGAITWAVYFMTLYLLSEAACELGFWQAETAGLSGLAWSILLLTALAVALSLYAGWWSWQAMQREQQRDYQVDADTAHDRMYFLGYGSLALNGLFAFLNLFIGLPALFLAPCGWGA